MNSGRKQAWEDTTRGLEPGLEAVLVERGMWLQRGQTSWTLAKSL